MPIYECMTRHGSLDATQRRHFAEIVTAIHIEETGAPGDFVQVIFPELPEGSSFTAGRSAAPAIIRGQIRAGRSNEVRSAIIERVFQAYQDISGADPMSILVTVMDVPASWAMEGGLMLPEPNKTDEDAWFAKIASKKAAAGT